MKFEEIEQQIFQYTNQFKDFLSPELWGNILLDCTKNELLILWLLYQSKEVNMSQIAEYLHTPLNTASGIVSRMEKRELIHRQRSDEDKRVVTISLSSKGDSQIQAILKEVTFYGTKIMREFSQEEIQLFLQMLDRIVRIMKEERNNQTTPSKVRKITIE